MERSFKYRKTGRTVTVWIMLVFSLICVFAVESNASAPFWARLAVWALPALPLWILIRNPISGIVLTDETLTIAPEGKAQRIQLSDIDHLSIKEGTHNLRYKLHLRNLDVLELSYLHFPGLTRTNTEFEARGVTVRAKRGLGF
jgi:hypothetical protein